MKRTAQTILRITIGFLMTAWLAFAGAIYSVQDLHMGEGSCSLASNGNAACAEYNGNGYSVYSYNASTETTSLVPLGTPVYNGVFVNASGEIAGNVTSQYGYLYNGTTLIDLPSNYYGAPISGLDNAGQVTESAIAQGVGVVFSTNGSGVTGAVDLPVADNEPPVISPNGLVAYNDGTGDNLYDLSTGTSTQIDSVTSQGGLTAVSDNGIVVGYYYTDGNSRTVIYEASAGSYAQICDSHTSCDGTVGSPLIKSVNSSGQAVGQDNSLMFLYSGGTVQDLNALLGSTLNTSLGGTFSLNGVFAINDSGQILAEADGYETGVGNYGTVVLLTPVDTIPEPGTLILFGAGTLVICLTSRRRSRKS